MSANDPKSGNRTWTESYAFNPILVEKLIVRFARLLACGGLNVIAEVFKKEPTASTSHATRLLSAPVLFNDARLMPEPDPYLPIPPSGSSTPSDWFTVIVTYSMSEIVDPLRSVRTTSTTGIQSGAAVRLHFRYFKSTLNFPEVALIGVQLLVFAVAFKTVELHSTPVVVVTFREFSLKCGILRSSTELASNAFE